MSKNKNIVVEASSGTYTGGPIGFATNDLSVGTIETKEEIIEKLIKDGHITLKQALILLDKQDPPVDVDIDMYIFPYNPPSPPYYAI